MNIVMIGTGYVGLVTGLGFAKLGHHVACVDTDINKIAELDLGRVPFYEAGVPALLKSLQEQGKIVFTTRLSDVIARAEVIVIAVGTPAQSNGACDLSFVYSVTDQLAELLDHPALIVVKSSVPVGTTRLVKKRLFSSLKRAGRQDILPSVHVAFVPEFLREGSALSDFLRPDRLVMGVDDAKAAEQVTQMHAGLECSFVTMSIESAELTKYAANAFLATKLSFINEMANLAEHTGADIREVAQGIGLDKRIGPHFLRAGIGYGGSCFPKDVSALAHVAGERGYGFKLLSAVIEVNNAQRVRFFNKVVQTLGPLKGRRIAVWGLAFKGGTDDIRESVAIDLVGRLVAAGASVCAYDPKAMPQARAILPDQVEFAATPIDAARGSEAVLVLTEWPHFSDVSFTTLHQNMVTPVIFDGRNLLSEANLESHGFAYYGVGLGRVE